ncbi:MAG TPA: hypothetical protein ENN77_00425 [Candidatus Wirthbacteria bacterium]|nr:hypothetical protein [Candidatus Wirthbacteria bacterium]
MLIHLIADYGVNDLAFNEVVHKLLILDQSLLVYPLSVPPFSTIATGFCIGQLALDFCPGSCIYSNTAPRKDDANGRSHNAGEFFVYAELDNGMQILTVNSGYSLSFVKNNIKKLHRVSVSNHGSQFRSRDNFPQAVVGILQGNQDFIGEQIDPATIPDIPKSRVAWIDGYGNIKTTIRQSEVKLQPGQEIQIDLNTTKHIAKYAGGAFEVHEGDLALAPGSSGGDDRFLEIFLRGGNARRLFHKARVEQHIGLRPYAYACVPEESIIKVNAKNSPQSTLPDDDDEDDDN